MSICQARHYRMVAKALSDNKPIVWEDDWDMLYNARRKLWEQLCFRIARDFGRDNPSFRLGKFLKACGMSDEAIDIGRLK